MFVDYFTALSKKLPGFVPTTDHVFFAGTVPCEKSSVFVPPNWYFLIVSINAARW